MKALFIFILAASSFTACAVTGEPIELAKACTTENDGKNFQIRGILSAKTSVYCSNRAKRMECGFDVVDAVGGDRKMGADVEVGSGPNTMDEVPKGYKKEELKIRDNASSLVSIGTEPVALTGRLSVSPDAKACFMQIYKIEK